jgi:cytochrome P450
MSESDQLEIAMEFMFTGASSVTSSLIWLVHHMSRDSAMVEAMREEASDVAHREGSRWLCGQAAGTCKVTEAALRETLRMYSPIHIGRLSQQEFTITNTRGELVTFPTGTDIMSNLWFMQVSLFPLTFYIIASRTYSF